MVYSLRWNEAAQGDLKKLGPSIAKRIVKKVEMHLVKDPEHIGEKLKHEWAAFYKYRVADDWRVIYQIHKQEIIIEVVKVGHRSEVYDR